MQYFQGHPDINVALLMSNNNDAFALKRATDYHVPTVVFNREEFKEGSRLIEALQRHQVTHLVLAGFLWLIPQYLLAAFRDRIVNIHPALLPKYGGKGMYGSKVHEAVKLAGDKETGITIHLVNEEYDKGKVLFQTSCGIEEKFDAVQIASCVQQLEHKHYPAVIEEWILRG